MKKILKERKLRNITCETPELEAFVIKWLRKNLRTGNFLKLADAIELSNPVSIGSYSETASSFICYQNNGCSCKIFLYDKRVSIYEKKDCRKYKVTIVPVPKLQLISKKIDAEDKFYFEVDSNKRTWEIEFSDVGNLTVEAIQSKWKYEDENEIEKYLLSLCGKPEDIKIREVYDYISNITGISKEKEEEFLSVQLVDNEWDKTMRVGSMFEVNGFLDLTCVSKRNADTYEVAENGFCEFNSTYLHLMHKPNSKNGVYYEDTEVLKQFADSTSVKEAMKNNFSRFSQELHGIC